MSNDAAFVWQKMASSLAESAAALGEVPVGCVIVDNVTQTVVSTGMNLKETLKDPTAHAEILAIRRACKILGHWRLTHHTMYVTLEPCLMCCGALLHSRIKKVYYSLKDPKGGAIESNIKINDINGLNHKIASKMITDESDAVVLKSFFKSLRSKGKSIKKI